MSFWSEVWISVMPPLLPWGKIWQLPPKPSPSPSRFFGVAYYFHSVFGGTGRHKKGRNFSDPFFNLNPLFLLIEHHLICPVHFHRILNWDDFLFPLHYLHSRFSISFIFQKYKTCFEFSSLLLKF